MFTKSSGTAAILEMYGSGILEQKEIDMLQWALVFLVVALIAAFLGFGGVAGTAAGIAQLLFYVFIVLFLISAVVSLLRGKNPPLPPV